MSVLEGGAQLVDAQAALGQPSRAREDELGQERAAVSLDDDAVGRVFHLDVGGHRYCLLFFFFFYAFVQYSTWPKGCLRAVGCVSGCPGSPLVLGDFLYPRAARICYLLKTQMFLCCCEQPFARRDRVGPGAPLTPARAGAAPK